MTSYPIFEFFDTWRKLRPTPQDEPRDKDEAATMIKDMMEKQIMELKKLWGNKRQFTFQVLNLAMIVFSALMIWKGLMFVTERYGFGELGCLAWRLSPRMFSHLCVCVCLFVC